MDTKRKEETVQAWALEKEREKYGTRDGDGLGKGSSEDVWEARRWMVRGAFGGDWGDLVVGEGGRGEGEGQGG